MRSYWNKKLTCIGSTFNINRIMGREMPMIAVKIHINRIAIYDGKTELRGKM